MRIFTKFLRSETGATAVEYALLSMLITAPIIAALSSYATSISNTMNEVSSNLK